MTSALDTDLTLAQLSTRVGIPARTIRDYQRRGLIPRPEIRGRTGWYGSAHEARLRLISQLKSQGFTLGSIAALMAQSADTSTAINAVRERAAQLEVASDELLPLDPALVTQLRKLDGDVLDTMERTGLIVRRGSSHAASANVMALLRQLIELGVRDADLRKVIAAIHTLTSSVGRATHRMTSADEALVHAIVRSLLDRSLAGLSAERK